MKQDIIGQQFGRLTVLQKVKKDGNVRSFWLCKCTCGNETVVEESHLKNGHTKSCGCYRRELPKKKRLDLSGHRYGRAVVLGSVTGKDGSEDFWRCQCDCGREFICYKENLRSGAVRSCGCLREETRKENMKKAIHFVNGTCIEKIASRGVCSNNTSGCRGVYRRENNRWRAAIGFQGKVYNLGSFEKYEDAVEARLSAEKKYYDAFLKAYENKDNNRESQ